MIALASVVLLACLVALGAVLAGAVLPPIVLLMLMFACGWCGVGLLFELRTLQRRGAFGGEVEEHCYVACRAAGCDHCATCDLPPWAHSCRQLEGTALACPADRALGHTNCDLSKHCA